MASPLQFDPTSLAKYGHLTLVARQLVEGFLTGVHKSPYKGFSVEFAEHLSRGLQALKQTKPGEKTALAPLWDRLADQIKRRGVVVILSDCFGDSGHLQGALLPFRHRRHEVMLFHVLAPEEIDFPFKK